jgi:ribose transport system ATP-binding protein
MSSVAAAPRRRGLRLRGWMPLLLLAMLLVALGGYTTNQSSDFLTTYNLNGLLLATVPLALVSMGQLNVLLVGTFDVSVGALTTLSVVVMSFLMGPSAPWYQLVGGALAVAGLGVLVGVFNAALVEFVGLSAIIATLATLSILNGFSLHMRPVANGDINGDVSSALTKSWGFMPISFIGVVVLAALWDVWLYRSRRGLKARAVGMDATSAQRLGMPARWVRAGAFVACSIMSAIGGLFLGAWIQIGDPNSGTSYTLTSIAACIVGGASFLGGRGSFVGAVMGSLFFFLIINVLPFLHRAPEYSYILTGSLTLIALVAYQTPELIARLRQYVDDLRGTRSKVEPLPGEEVPADV